MNSAMYAGQNTDQPGGPGSGPVRRSGRGMNRAWLRWVPAAAVPAVIAAAVLAGPLPARAGDPLPTKSPAEVLALLKGHTTNSFSGTLEQESELGLPELPSAAPSAGPGPGDGAASLMEFLTGQHTARIFVDGKTRARIQIVDRLAERDIVRLDNDVWFYSSKDNSAAHLTLPGFAQDLPLTTPEQAGPENIPTPHTPQELAEKFLAAVDPSTEVSVGPDVEVAGRAAYNLLLEPRTAGTLVGEVAIAVDGVNGMPLSVQVTASGATQPAFEAGFTRLSLEAPPADLFNFVPPPGSTVEELQLRHPHPWLGGSGVPGDPGKHIVPDGAADAAHANDRPQLTGSGWETVVEIPAEAAAGAAAGNWLSRNPVLDQAAVAVPGGRVLSTALFSVLFTDDGRIFAGMVPPDRLQAASAAP